MATKVSFWHICFILNFFCIIKINNHMIYKQGIIFTLYVNIPTLQIIYRPWRIKLINRIVLNFVASYRQSKYSFFSNFNIHHTYYSDASYFYVEI